MLMVILGAGASYDSQLMDSFGYSISMPMVNKLFSLTELSSMDHSLINETLPLYPAVKPLLLEMENLIKTKTTLSAEEHLGNLQERSDGDEVLQRQLMAMRYFIRDIVSKCSKKITTKTGGTTAYSHLVSMLHNWSYANKQKVVVVNFNYDELFEDAVRDMGSFWKTANIDDYLNAHDFSVYKLHGSVDWFHWIKQANGEIVSGNDNFFANRAIYQAPSIELSNNDIHYEKEEIPEGYYRIPALALPVTNKYSFSCPDHVIDDFKSKIPETQKILIIGWRGVEEHFKSLLKEIKSPVELMVVSSSEDEAQEIHHRLGSYFDTIGNKMTPGAGFRNSLSDDSIKEFLNK